MTDHRAHATITALASHRPGGAARTHTATTPAAIVLRNPMLSHLLDPDRLREVLTAALSGVPVVAEFADGRRYRLGLDTTGTPCPVPTSDPLGGWIARHLTDSLSVFVLDADRYRVQVTRCDGDAPAPAADQTRGRASA
jgi:hypothetical protein